MTFKSLFLPLLISLSSAFLLSAAFGGDQAAAAPLGRWQLIENVTAPEVTEVAQFAVAEHNKKTDSTLKFARVVAGLNYRLIIAAKDGAVTGKYEAVVYVRPWAHYKSLKSFRVVQGSRDAVRRRN